MTMKEWLDIWWQGEHGQKFPPPPNARDYMPQHSRLHTAEWMNAGQERSSRTRQHDLYERHYAEYRAAEMDVERRIELLLQGARPTTPGDNAVVRVAEEQ